MPDPDPNTTNILTQLIILVILTLVNGFFAGAEMAVVSVNKNRIKLLAEKGNKSAKSIQLLFDDSTKFLSTIQVAITFAGFFSSATAATGISQVLGNWMSERNIPYAQSISMVGITILLSYCTLVFGELVPKRIALQKAETFSLFVVRPILFISKILAPFIKLLSASTNLFLKVFGMNTHRMEEYVSKEEIKAMLETGEESGVFNETEKEMINSIFSFDDTTAEQIMVPRIDVFAIDIQAPLDSYLDDLLETRHSRIPVYRKNTDDMIGILNMKDFVIEAKKHSFEEVDIEKLITKPYCVPENKNIDVLFKEMQRAKTHMALLIDEYGGFSGIVTIEDLIEEIVGDIHDEYEEVSPDYTKVDESTYLLSGSMNIDDLNELLGVNLESENFETISGLLIDQIGTIPSEEQKPTVKIESLTFNVKSIKDKRIDKVLLSIET